MNKLWTNILLICCLVVCASAQASTYTKTKYPLVLVHGVFGFDDVLGIDYFYRIPFSLSRSGAKVYVAAVSAANSSEVRGEQLLLEVQQILALTGAEKVNLIGHSQGAQTVRYVASVRPDLIASVTSVGGVNWGTPVADIVRNVLPPGSVPESIITTVGNGLTSILGWFSGNAGLPQDSVAALEVLTTQGSLAFNADYPEGIPDTYCGSGDLLASNGVEYFSWSGGSAFTNAFDLLDASLLATSFAFNEANDGLVSSCSSHLGYVIKNNYRMNHIDEINHIFGIHHLFETDPITLYRTHANRLKNRGL
jgi:triacylglycerol lipase